MKKTDCLSVISYLEMKNVRFMTEAEIMSETPADSDKKSDKIRLFPFKCLKTVNEFL